MAEKPTLEYALSNGSGGGMEINRSAIVCQLMIKIIHIASVYQILHVQADQGDDPKIVRHNLSRRHITFSKWAAHQARAAQ